MDCLARLGLHLFEYDFYFIGVILEALPSGGKLSKI